MQTTISLKDQIPLLATKGITPLDTYISIIIPAHNEAACLRDNIKTIERFINKLTNSYEIIISEDGSLDGTDLIAAELSCEYMCISYMHFHERCGKGKALKRALINAKGKIIVFMDADLATSIEDLPKILCILEKGYDGVIGSRNIKGSIVKRSFLRSIASTTYNLIIRFLFNDGIHDHQCGFKAFRRNILEIIEDIQSNGFLFDTELLIRSKLRGYSIYEFPVKWEDPNGRKSKVRLITDGMKMGLELVQLRARIWKHIRY